MAKDYSPEEIQEFKEKDLRIVRQNALSHATQIALGVGGAPDTVADVTLALADRFVSYVYGSMEFPIQIKPETKLGAATTNKITQSAAPGVVKNIQVSPEATPVVTSEVAPKVVSNSPAPSDREKETLRKMAYSLAPDEPGKVVDLEEFTKRVYTAFGKYPGNIRSLELVKQKVTIPYVEV